MRSKNQSVGSGRLKCGRETDLLQLADANDDRNQQKLLAAEPSGEDFVQERFTKMSNKLIDIMSHSIQDNLEEDDTYPQQMHNLQNEGSETNHERSARNSADGQQESFG